MALEQNGGSWVLYNIAALYWRVMGNVGQAIECLRHAIVYSTMESGTMLEIFIVTMYKTSSNKTFLMFSMSDVYINDTLYHAPRIDYGNIFLK